MIPFDPPNIFRNGQTLDQNDVQENVHHWVQLIKRIADQRYLHTSVSLRYGQDNFTPNLSEDRAVNERTIRWYAPYDVYVEGVALFLNQSSAVTGTLQLRLSRVPAGLTSSILIEASLAATTTTNLVQPFSKFTGFLLAKSTTYDIIYEAQSSNTFDLRMLDLQLQIRTDRWSSDSSIPSSTIKRIDASGNATATNINTILADVEADIATCSSNNFNPVPSAWDFRDFTSATASGVMTGIHPVAGAGSIMGKWGRTRISALQFTSCVSATGITGASTVDFDVLGKAGTNKLQLRWTNNFAAATNVMAASFATTATYLQPTGELDDTNDDYTVEADSAEGGAGTLRCTSSNFIVWEG